VLALAPLFALDIDLGRLLQPSFLGGGILFYVVAAFSLMKIAERDRELRDQAVAAWIPIVNLVMMLRLAKKPVWWIVLFLVPGLNFVMWLLLCVGLSKARGGGLFLGLLMTFVPIVGFPILALSQD
jgi:hypothetical protein